MDGIFRLDAILVFSSSMGVIIGFSGVNAFSKWKYIFLASINSILSFKIRFDPIVVSISFLVFGSPLANRSWAVQANSKVCSASFNCCSTRCTK